MVRNSIVERMGLAPFPSSKPRVQCMASSYQRSLFLRTEIALKSAYLTCPRTCDKHGRSAVASFKTDPDPYDVDAHAPLIAAPPVMRAAVECRAGIAWIIRAGRLNGASAHCGA